MAEIEDGDGVFGAHIIRSIYIAASLFWCSMLSFSMWTQPTTGDFTVGYGLSAFGAFMLFMGSTISLLYGIMKKSQKINGILWEKWILRIITFLYIAGGLFYFSGGCAVAHSYNTQNVPYISGSFLLKCPLLDCMAFCREWIYGKLPF